MAVRHSRILPPLLIALLLPSALEAQLYSWETEFLKLIYYSKAHEYLVPHVTRSFENSLGFHRRLFHYTPSEPIVILLQDFGDYGHGGTSTVPWNYINIGIEPFDYVYETMPTNERMNWLMHHELVHVVATDRGAGIDNSFRRFFRGKVAPTLANPISMFYSFLTSPRWYSPRWYHEGIAVFLETWMAGGLGRVLGGYDEMAFRTMVREKSYFYDVVGLESEGTTKDFQVGQNSYLYGTRFVTYLALQYGPHKLIQWFNRAPGSRRYFSSQFRKVYGTSLEKEWNRWIRWEHKWQRQNLERIAQYPLTPYRKVYPGTLGSVSRSFYDPATGQLYAAVDYPGRSAHLAAIDMKSGAIRKLTDVNGPALYYVSSLAYDPSTGKLFYTTDNTRGWRDLNQIDVRTRKKKLLFKDCRVGDLVLNPKDHSIWGTQHHNALTSLVRIRPPYNDWDHLDTVLTLEFGKDLFDLDISPDGRTLSASLVEISGRQQLVKLDIEGLLAGRSGYDVLYEFTNNGPENFVFSPDGRYLYGTSYYTGVSNVFRYDLERRKIEAVSNTDTGFFRPLPLSGDKLLVYRYTSTGFVPVTIPIRVLKDVNAIRYLGQAVVERYPELKKWNVGSPAKVDLKKVTTYKGEYKAFKRIRLASIYPVVERYKNSVSYGMRLNFADPLGLENIDLTAAVSPHTNLAGNERVNLKFKFDHFPWTFQAKWNASDFYDFFSPTKVTRKGYSGSVRYQNFLISEHPRSLKYTLGAAGYGGLDTLPDFQNVRASFSKFFTFFGRLDYSNVRRTIGAVEPEKGIAWSLVSENNVVNNNFFPRVYGTLDYGFLLPIDHSSIWIRTAAGESFSDDRSEPFANFFFGGFGNNWVDHHSIQRYREYYAFPGIEINDVGGTNFSRVMTEWTLPPIRFRHLGVPAFYTNWARFSLFSSGLVSNLDDKQLRRTLYNAGGQLDFRLVLFSNMESTFSLGYALAVERGRSTNEFMFSLKLLR